MGIVDYLNSIYDSDDIFDYQYGKIYPHQQSFSESDTVILELILDIVRLNENYDRTTDIFQKNNSVLLPDINSVTREVLAPLLSTDIAFFPLAIRARVADFLWTTVKDFKSAPIAIRSYLELYERLWDEENWPDCIDAIKRATNIAAGYHKKGAEHLLCLDAVRRGLDRTQGKDRLYLSSSLLGILAEHKCKIDSDVMGVARNTIEAAKSDRNFEKAQNVLEILAKMDPANKSQYYEEAGDITQMFASNPAIRRVHILNQALRYYILAGSIDKQNECRTQIEEAQSHVIEEMELIQTEPIDITSMVNEVKEVMRGAKNLIQAIISLGSFVRIDTREELLHCIQNAGLFARIFPSARVDHQGRQLFCLQPLPLGEELSIEDENVQKHMWDKAKQLQEMNANITLKYALSELNNIYQYNEDDLNFLVYNNGIVPIDSEEIIRKGLFIGLKGDLYTALHILMPQMENVIRYLVELCGGRTCYIENDESVKLNSLSKLLDDPELNECCDPDVMFCLKGLLDRREGSNLRNEIAHARLKPGNSLIGLYFLGFFIKALSCHSRSCIEECQKMIMKRHILGNYQTK